MASSKRQPFVLNGEFITRKSFVYNGKQFNTGDVFPHKELECSERRMSLLYGSGHLIANNATEKQSSAKTHVTPVVDKTVDKKEAKKQRAAERRKAAR